MARQAGFRPSASKFEIYHVNNCQHQWTLLLQVVFQKTYFEVKCTIKTDYIYNWDFQVFRFPTAAQEIWGMSMSKSMLYQDINRGPLGHATVVTNVSLQLVLFHHSGWFFKGLSCSEPKRNKEMRQSTAVLDEEFFDRGRGVEKN